MADGMASASRGENGVRVATFGRWLAAGTESAGVLPRSGYPSLGPVSMTSSWLMRSPSRRAARQPTMTCQNVELFGIQDRCDGRSLVVHRWTYERKLCGGAGRLVELVQNQNGDGAIAIGEEIRPVQDLFAIAVAECDAADQSDKHTALTRDGSFKRNLCELPTVFEKVSIVASHEWSGSLGVFEGACFPYCVWRPHLVEGVVVVRLHRLVLPWRELPVGASNLADLGEARVGVGLGPAACEAVAPAEFPRRGGGRPRPRLAFGEQPLACRRSCSTRLLFGRPGRVAGCGQARRRQNIAGRLG